jgi:hypothetical protein
MIVPKMAPIIGDESNTTFSGRLIHLGYLKFTVRYDMIK